MKKQVSDQEQCSAYLDGMLEGAERAAFEAQLAADPECAHYLDELSTIRETLQTEVPLPAGLHEDIMNLVFADAQQGLAPRKERRRHFPVFTMVAVAAVVVMLVMSGTLSDWIFGRSSSSATDSDNSMVAAAGSVESSSTDTAESTATEAQLSIPLDGEAAGATQQTTEAVAPDGTQSTVAATDAQREQLEENAEKAFQRLAIPESVAQKSFASCYVATGKGEMPEITATLLTADEKGIAVYYTIGSNMTVIGDVLDQLTRGGYNAVAIPNDNRLTIDQTSDSALLIVIKDGS